MIMRCPLPRQQPHTYTVLTEANPETGERSIFLGDIHEIQPGEPDGIVGQFRCLRFRDGELAHMPTLHDAWAFLGR